jgi:hypothetical protein
MPRYVLREIGANGRPRAEEFDAPDDRTALRRISEEVRWREYELWRGDTLIRQGKPKL